MFEMNSVSCRFPFVCSHVAAPEWSDMATMTNLRFSGGLQGEHGLSNHTDLESGWVLHLPQAKEKCPLAL